jgi:hypothetical protein
MALIALCADKGSPGVTTAALALAAEWPCQAAVAEVDPSGGDLALRLTDGWGRFELADQPNLLTFAAASRRGGPEAGLLQKHCQTTSSGIRVLRGLVSAEQAGGLERLWPDMADALRATVGCDVLADLGRLLPGSPTWPIAAAADEVVVVAPGTAEGLAHLRERVRGVLPAATFVAVVLVASARHGQEAVRAAAEVLDRDALPAEVVGFLAIDIRAVAALQRGERSGVEARSLLARTARTLASLLRLRVGTVTPTSAWTNGTSLMPTQFHGMGAAGPDGDRASP